MYIILDFGWEAMVFTAYLAWLSVQIYGKDLLKYIYMLTNMMWISYIYTPNSKATLIFTLYIYLCSFLSLKSQL